MRLERRQFLVGGRHRREDLPSRAREERLELRDANATVDSATRLVRDARRACEASDMPRASANARAALELLHSLEERDAPGDGYALRAR
jgi:hypothetical protein